MNSGGPFWLDPRDEQAFPDPALALRQPDGLLAIGGDLSPRRLLSAYHQGIFPWYSAGQPILWWSPDPRAVLFPERLKLSRSLRKTLRKDLFQITVDQAFEKVVNACAEPRRRQEGTWITPEMKEAYYRLHTLGYAHSVESWADGELVGGLYGLALGRVFFGESMFSTCTDASKVAFVTLVRQLQRWDFSLIDCQIGSRHLASLGAEELPRELFRNLLADYVSLPGPDPGPWGFDAAPEQHDLE